MKACVDVHYLDPIAAAACVLFREWTDGAAASEHTSIITSVAPL